jgi:uncharacterized protein (DUF2252 family)
MPERMTRDERRAMGTQARTRAPRAAHAEWVPAADRPSPVALLVAQETTREPDLVPVRHGRMMVSPFTFYRGAATVMAEDLKDTPTAGLNVQVCGDAHLLNFGVFGSPERRLVFDLNDFDETLPGPFEYDVKRMAASFVIAARAAGFSRADSSAAALASVAGYREAMAEFAGQRTMDVWYASLDEDAIKRAMRDVVAETAGAAKPQKGGGKNAGKNGDKNGGKGAGKQGKKAAKGQLEMARQAQKRVAQISAKAHTRDSLQALSKLAELVGDRYRIVSQPPVVVPLRDAPLGALPDDAGEMLERLFREYRATLQPDRRHLLEQFEIVDVARKVVGVGSVGTRCFIALLQGRDSGDPLFLQVKEATASVLEGYLPRSRYRQHGQRVVQGQRLMQAVSDIFLGWTRGVDVSRHFYWRQLRDMKGSFDDEGATPLGLTLYGQVCGWTMARAHARSGDPVAIAAYLGSNDSFDRSIEEFSQRYADQNERDYDAFVAAVKDGQLEAVEGVLRSMATVTSSTPLGCAAAPRSTASARAASRSGSAIWSSSAPARGLRGCRVTDASLAELASRSSLRSARVASRITASWSTACRPERHCGSAAGQRDRCTDPASSWAA